jgi:hypothetical protein
LRPWRAIWRVTPKRCGECDQESSARGEGIPVIWVQHSDDELAFGSPQWQWAPELTMEALGRCELEHNPKNNRMRAK